MDNVKVSCGQSYKRAPCPKSRGRWRWLFPRDKGSPLETNVCPAEMISERVLAVWQRVQKGQEQWMASY